MIGEPDINGKDDALQAGSAGAMLAAVAFATNRLLIGEQWHEQIDAILQRLGTAAGVSRAALCQREDSDDGDIRVSLRSSWVGPDSPPVTDRSELGARSFEADGFGRWIQSFERGEPIAGHVDRLPAVERAFLAARGIRSLVAVPILVSDTWWGFFTLVDCREGRQWPSVIVDALVAVGNMLGANLEQARIAQVAKESERQYRDLVENLTVGVQQTRPDSADPIRMANPAAAQIFGYDDMDEYLETRPIDSYVDPADRQHLMQKLLADGVLINEEVRRKRKDGTPIWIAVTARAVRDDQGQIDYLDCSLRDITARKEAEQALRDERELLQTVIDTIPDAVYLKDTEGRFLFVNDRFVRGMPGDVTRATFIGKTDEGFFKPEEIRAWAERDRRIIETGEPIIGERHSYINSFGEPAWTMSSICPCHNTDGDVVGLVGVVRNVTAVLETEKSLRAERQLLRTVIDAIPSAVYLKDAEGRFLLVNKGFVEGMGTDDESAFLGKTDYDFFTEPAADAWRQRDEHILQTSQPVMDEPHVFTDVEGDTVWLTANIVPFTGADGRPAGLVGVIHNITEAKRVEQALHDERELLRTVIDTIPDSVYLKGTEGRFLVVNNQFVRGVRLKSESDVLGKTDFDLFPPDSVDEWRQRDLEIIQTGQAVIGNEKRVVNRYGEEHWQSENIAPFRDGNGQVAGLVGVVRDITEQRKAQQRLQDERRLLRQVIDTISEAIYLKDTEGKYLVVNKQFADTRPIPGWTTESCIDRTDFDFADAEKAEEWRQLDLEVFAGTPTIDLERSTIKDDGTRLWVLTNKTPLRDAEGNIIGLVGAVRNITASKVAEQSLRDERQMLRTIIDTIPSALYMKDLDGTYVLANETFCRDSGFNDESEIVGKTDFDLFSRERAEHCRGKDAELIASGRPVLNREIRNVDADGNEGWVLFSSAPIPNDAGGFIGLIGITDNITEQKQSEQALRDSEAKYRGVIESIPVGMCQIDPAVGGRIIMANPAAARMFGYDSVEDVMRANLAELYPSTRQRRQLLTRVLDQGQVVGEEIQAVRRDGMRLWVAVTVTAVRDESGDVEHFDALLEDITDRKLAAQAVQEAHSKLLSAREAERRRLATELHDSLGQSLVALNLAVQGVYVGHDSEFDPARLDALKGAANRCNALIEEVRHICHGLFPPILEALGLEAALRGIARDCQGQITATLDYPEHLAGCRFSDEVEIVLFRIAQEAVQNALRHSQAENLDLALQHENGWVRLTITDDGQGFDVGGAAAGGLGLTTMGERARAVNGELRIESQPGRTCVSIQTETPIIRTDTPESDHTDETDAQD